MSRVQIRAKRSDIQCLKELVHKFDLYLELFPPPIDDDYVFELQPAKVKDSRAGDIFAWEWPATTMTLEQESWKIVFTRWLNQWFNVPFSENISGISIRILKPSADFQKTDYGKQIIKGEGLATFSSVTPRFKMEDLVISDELREKIKNTIGILKHTNLIYDTWGFSEVDSFPRAVLSFYGPPGTGKTMAAHCIANELNKNILIANFAEIESKYVGDSPKNLENIFTVAKTEDAVLFFDEADSFLGKRLTSISSSSDQAVNSLRSKLLQLLEEHTGLVIFCTNLLKNYDKAFESRILRSLKFDLPDKDCRIKLFRKMIPKKVPFENGEELNDAAFEEFAEETEGFSGRIIKNTVLQVLCKGASEEKTAFKISDFKDGITAMKAEIEALKNERGELSKEKTKELESKISENLKTGNFAVRNNSDSDKQ